MNTDHPMAPYRRINRSRSNRRYKGLSPLSWVSDNSTSMGSLNSCLNAFITAHIPPTQSISRRLRIVATQSSVMNMADSWVCALKQIWLGTVPPHACSARSAGNNLNTSTLLNDILVCWSRTGWPFIVNCTTKDSISFTSGQRTAPNPSRCLLSPQPRLARAATTSSKLEMVERKGRATVRATSWASWFTDAQQSPTITTL